MIIIEYKKIQRKRKKRKKKMMLMIDPLNMEGKFIATFFIHLKNHDDKEYRPSVRN